MDGKQDRIVGGAAVKVAIVAALLGAVGIVVYVKGQRMSEAARQAGEAPAVKAGVSSQAAPALPRLIDLGADKCIPCQMMAPILDELKEEYRGKLTVTFIDVWKDPVPGREYGIRAIPTQIFIGPDGNELFRHEGFFAKEDILAKWRELGFDLEG